MGVVLRGSEGADVVCLRPLLALGEFERHLLSLLEGLVPATFDGGVVDEDVFTAVLGCDEAVALLTVEPLHDSLTVRSVIRWSRAARRCLSASSKAITIGGCCGLMWAAQLPVFLS